MANDNHVCISVIMPTYNRAGTLDRAIGSVLAQDFTNFELVVVDDGSTDHTQEILGRWTDARLVRLKHAVNRGVTAALNTGLNAMRGDWFTFLGSDDELVPNALTTLLRVPAEIDPAINAITCNCMDTSTGRFSGLGLNEDQWLDFEKLVTQCHGEHWGLTKRELLGDLRFNEKLRGGEAVVWYKISRHARRYYIHKALRIYHTEGADRLCAQKRRVNLDERCAYYRELAKETEYLEILRQYRPAEYAACMRNLALAHAMAGDTKEARKAFRGAARLWSVPERLAVWAALVGGPRVARGLVRAALAAR